MKRNFFVFLCVILILLISANVFAAGISGSKLRIRKFFEPNMVYEFSYSLYSNSYSTNSYSVYAKHELAEFVELDQTRFENVPPATYIPFSGRIRFPESFDEPGVKNTYICVIEDCPHDGGTCGRASSCAVIEFMVLHDGIYYEFNIPDSKAGENSPIEIYGDINNLGNSDITDISGNVKIFDFNDNLVQSGFFEYSDIVKSTSQVRLSSLIEDHGLAPGDYKIVGTVVANGVEKVDEATLRIGTLDINILGHTPSLEVGGIKPFQVNVESVWDNSLDVYADIVVSNNEFSTSTRTITKKILPWEINSLDGFLDISNFPVGEYDTLITAHFKDNSKIYNGRIKIIEEKIEGPIEEVTTNTSIFNTTTITISLVILVIILTIINTYLALRKNKNSKDKK